jgi:hypothetical protein
VAIREIGLSDGRIDARFLNRALPAFGAVEEPEDLPFYRLPFCRGRETPRHLAR